MGKVNEAKLDKLLEDPKVHALVMKYIADMKGQKKDDYFILAAGVLITNMARTIIEKK